MADIRLNIFTNIVHRDLRKIPVFETINSIDKTFSIKNFSSVSIYIHPYPVTEKTDEYKLALTTFMSKWGVVPDISLTESLWDGYVRSIRDTTEPHALQMEHDWHFYRQRITHSATEIVEAMRKNSLPYLRFNKRENGIVTGMITHVQEYSRDGFSYCKDNVMSNNPHFIDISYYRDIVLPVLLKSKGEGSLGIERELTSELANGASYGPMGHPKTITHLNGKKIFQKSQMSTFDKINYFISRLKRDTLKIK